MFIGKTLLIIPNNAKMLNLFWFFVKLVYVQVDCTTTTKDTLMNKSELVASIAKKSGLSQAQSADALNAFISTVGEALEAGDSIALVGFGTFSVKERAARTGRNPQTGAEMQIPASKVPSFKAGKGLKDAVNPAQKAPTKAKKK